MTQTDNQVVHVLTAAPIRTGPDGRPISVRKNLDDPGIVNVSMDSFQAGMSNFMNSVRIMVADVEHKAGEYEIDKLEIAASIGVDGKVSFLGSGVGMESAASFTITLTKPDVSNL